MYIKMRQEPIDNIVKSKDNKQCQYEQYQCKIYPFERNKSSR
jgi:hypothetical protein